MAKFHLACPITGQAVCYCDSSGGLASKLGVEYRKTPGKALAPLGSSSTKKMWNLWQKLAAGQIMQEPEPVEVLVPCMYSYERRPEDLTVDGLTRSDILELVKAKEYEAQQAVLRAAQAYAAVGRMYAPPQGLDMRLEPLEIKEADSAEALAEAVMKVQEELKAIEVEEGRLQQARAAQHAQQAQQMKAANERKQAAVRQYEVEKAEVDRREAEKNERERKEQERREAEARAEAERLKEIERQRLEAERRAEEERREAERKVEAERKAEAERQRQEAEKLGKEKERQKKMAEAQKAKAENERREAEARRQAQASAEEARRAREAELKTSERRRKSTMEALAHILDDEVDWLEEDKADEDDEEFMPEAKGTAPRARQRKGGSSAADKKGGNSAGNGGSAFRALEKLADSSLLVSPRQHLGSDATLLQFPDGMTDDDFDGLGSEDDGDSGGDSPILAPGSRGIRSSANRGGKPRGRAAAAPPGNKGVKASGNKKPPMTTSLNDPRDRSNSAAAMNRVVSTIPSKDKDAALQALRSVSKLPPGRTTTSPAGASGGNSNNPLGKAVPTKPRDRPSQPGGAKAAAGAKAGAGMEKGLPPRGTEKSGRSTGPSAPKPPSKPIRPVAPPPKFHQQPPTKAPASNSRPAGGSNTNSRGGAKVGGGRAGKTLLKEKDFRPDLVGKTLMLLWPEDATWWKALVLLVDMKGHTAVVYYDTGEEETLNLLESINKGEVAWLQEGIAPVPPPADFVRGGPPPSAPAPKAPPASSAFASKHSAPPPKADTVKKRKVPPSNPHRPNTHATGKGVPPPHETNKRPRGSEPPSKPFNASSPRPSGPRAGAAMKDDMSLDSVTELLSIGSAAMHRMVEVYLEDEDIWFRGHIIRVDDHSITVEYLHGVIDELFDDADIKIKLLE